MIRSIVALSMMSACVSSQVNPELAYKKDIIQLQYQIEELKNMNRETACAIRTLSCVQDAPEGKEQCREIYLECLKTVRPSLQTE